MGTSRANRTFFSTLLATLDRMDISVTARPADAAGVVFLVDLYRKLETEMSAIHPMWPRADGLDEPVEESFRACLRDVDTRIYLGEIDGYPLGFILGRSRTLLVHEAGVRVAAIRMVFVEQEARGVGVGEVMRDTLMEEFRRAGHHLFDAHVLPGHRLAKNFFEAGGFAARSITMHHSDLGNGGRRIRAHYRPPAES